MQKPRVGDLFAIPLARNMCVIGQVRLDPTALIKQRMLPADSSLSVMGRTLLIDVFRDVMREPAPMVSSDIVVGGFVGDNLIVNGEWPIIGHEYFDWRTIEFPEWLTSVNNQPILARGEVHLPLDISTEEMDALRVSKSPLRAHRLSTIILNYIGRKDLIEERIRDNPWQTTVQYKDLRFSEHRQYIYQCAGVDPTERYVDLAARHGIDTGRLFGEPQLGFTGCPYCIHPIGDGDRLCPACGQDTTRDAPLEFSAIEALKTKYVTCEQCGASRHPLATICVKCR